MPSTSHRTAFTDEVPEQTTPIIEFTIADENEVGFKPEELALTYYDARTGSIINSRNAQNVLDQNNVTTSALGVTVWELQQEDTVLVNIDGNVAPISNHETHIALFEWRWSGGTKYQKHEFQFMVVNLAKVV